MIAYVGSLTTKELMKKYSSGHTAGSEKTTSKAVDQAGVVAAGRPFSPTFVFG